jgi:hypothetical protein
LASHYHDAPIHSPANLQEHRVKVYQILFLVWIIVFAFWVVKQFSDHNKRSDK